MINNKAKSYPVPVSGRKGLMLSIAIGLFIALFLWFFEPFDLDAYSNAQVFFFGAITFFVFFVGHNVLPFFFPNLYKEERWTLYTQVLFYVILLFIIATLNGLYINYVQDLSFSWDNYWFIIIRTLVLGFFPIVLYTLISFNLKYKSMVAQAAQLNHSYLNKKEEQKEKRFQIKTELQKELISIDSATFIFARANNNYVEVHSKNKQPKLYRIKLSSFEKEVKEAAYIVRVHRSYIINLDRITKVSGNAQGLKLMMEDTPHLIPVSRKYVDFIKKELKK